MKCVLHIGTEKTGTTLLQHWLYANRANLQTQRIALSDTLGKPNNRLLPSYFQKHFDDFFASKSIRTAADKERYFAGFLDRFAAEAAQKAALNDTFVITSEHFHSRLDDARDIERLADYLRTIFDEIRVICYFREQSELRKSLYSTALRVGYATELFEFQPAASPSFHYYNFDLMFSKWANAFGKTNVEAVLYDRSGFMDGDIRKDFIRRVLPSVDIDALSYDGVSGLNEKLSLLQAKAAIAINRNSNRQPGSGDAGIRGNSLFSVVLSCDALEHGELFDPRQAEMFDTFAESNKSFFEKFLPGLNGFPKPENRADPNEGVSLSIYEVGDIISRLVGDIAKSVSNRMLLDQDADLLRDVALKYERGGKVSKSEAIALMRLAHLARPNGSMIEKKLAEWEAMPGEPEDAGNGGRPFQVKVED